MVFHLTEIEEILGYKFNNPELLRRCFVHPSYANEQREELLNTKQGEFNNSVDKNEEGIRNESYVSNPKKYKEKKANPKKEKIKSKIKDARKNLKQNINIQDTKKTKKANPKAKKNVNKKRKNNKNKNNEILKFLAFMAFVVISLIFITKMIFF